MKNLWYGKALLGLGLALMFGGVPLWVADAHDPLPPEVRTFIREHPNATDVEVRAFAEKLSTNATTKRLFRAAEDSSNPVAFIRVGMEHIWAGNDHILFLIALALTTVSLVQVLRLSLTFTLAHSITLILAGTAALTVSARIVEPIIAFSIAAVAALAIYRYQTPSRTATWSSVAVIFLFGLFHGLGFAGLLTDLRIPDETFLSSLVLFNVGIEFGQLASLAVAFPLLYLFRKSRYAREFHISIATALIVIGVVWGIARLLPGVAVI